MKLVSMIGAAYQGVGNPDRPSLILLLFYIWYEFVLFRTTVWTDPIGGKAGKWCLRFDAAGDITDKRVIDVVTHRAYPCINSEVIRWHMYSLI